MKVIIVEVTRAANTFGQTHLAKIREAYDLIAEIVSQVLTHVAATLEGLTYTDELREGNTVALRFKAMVGDRELEGIDFLELDDEDRVARPAWRRSPGW